MLHAIQSVLGDEALTAFFHAQHAVTLFFLIAVILLVLAKAADKLVDEAVVLSARSGLPKVIIGATVVSLGTTSPEAAVSVLAALRGDPGLALGNAVGSIICDTGLILGLACVIAPPMLPRAIVNRQGWLQFGAGVLLVAACWPLGGGNPFVTGGHLSQAAGLVFVALLAGYLWFSVRWARREAGHALLGGLEEIEEHAEDAAAPVGLVVVKLLAAVALVVLASHALIPAIREAADRIGVPSSVVAATLVAFGTSLPELVTAVTASLKGHGDLAVGNVIGADILNVLFVAGVSAAVTPHGLAAPDNFFRVLFPAMLVVLVVFRIGVAASGDRMRRPFGFVLLATYAAAVVLSYSALN